jgi:hypothetical protein
MFVYKPPSLWYFVIAVQRDKGKTEALILAISWVPQFFFISCLLKLKNVHDSFFIFMSGIYAGMVRQLGLVGCHSLSTSYLCLTCLGLLIACKFQVVRLKWSWLQKKNVYSSQVGWYNPNLGSGVKRIEILGQSELYSKNLSQNKNKVYSYYLDKPSLWHKTMILRKLTLQFRQ